MFAALLAMIPGVLPIIEYFFKAKADVEVARVNAYKETGVAAVQASAIEAEGRAKTWGFISGNKLLVLLVIAFAGPIVVFEWKVVVWDTVLQLGSTAPVKGQVGDWMNVIIGSIFGSSTVLAVSQLWWTTKP